MAIADGDRSNDNDQTSRVNRGGIPHLREAPFRLPVRHLIRSSVLLLACLTAQRLVAQSTTSLLPDANLLAPRTLRFRSLVSWTRYDELLGTGGVVPRNIASTLATDSLGSAQVPAFAPIESAIRTTAALPTFRLTAGNVAAIGDSRIVTAPLIVEYGLTSRMTIGLVVPLVETRTTLYAQLNPKVGTANVGPNPALLAASAAAGQNLTLVQSFRNASSVLQGRVTQCQATPSDPTCTTILSQLPSIQSLMQNSGVFAGALENLYGTDHSAHPGLAYVPLDLSPAQAAINAQIQSYAAQYKAILGTDVITGKVTPAAGPGAQLDFQSLLTAVGIDSLRSTDHASIGDVSLGLSYQVINTYGDTSAEAANTPKLRVAANGAFRFPTGQLGNRNRLFDLPTGYGETGIIGSVAADMQFRRRVSATATASYTAQLGSVPVNRVPGMGNAIYPLAPAVPGTFTPGNVIAISFVPRYRLAGYLAVTGQYSFVQTGSDTYTIAEAPSGVVLPISPFGLSSWTAQQIGVGFTYSSIVRPTKNAGAIPFETTFTHLETIAGSGGPLNKTSRDQIELRVYWKR